MTPCPARPAAVRERENGGDVYEAKVTRRGESREMEVDEEKTLLERDGAA